MIRANFFLARNQCLELSLLDRLLGARGLAALSRLDFRKDLLIGEPFQCRLHRGFPLPLLDQLVKVLDELQVMLPDLVDSLRNGLVLVGERDHAHRLREVRVLAVRMSRRLGSPHGSFMNGPSQIREPSQCPRVFVGSLIASMIGRSAWPHSQRTQTSERSPLVPRSSIQRGRRQVVRPPWAKAYQSMSPMWPFLHALTKRIGTTDCDF